METARHYRVFPGEGVYSEQLLELVRILDDAGYRGDYSFEVFNDDYRQISVATVAERARSSVKWIAGQIGPRTLPQRRGPAQAGGFERSAVARHRGAEDEVHQRGGRGCHDA